MAFQRSAGSSVEVPLLNMDGSLMEENKLISVCMAGLHVHLKVSMPSALEIYILRDSRGRGNR